MGWLLVLGIKEGLVECATVCVKSVVILLVHAYLLPNKPECFQSDLLKLIPLLYVSHESKVLFLLETCFDLTRPPHFPSKFKSWAGKLLKIWGSNPAQEGQNCFVLFSFHFQILHTKLGTFDFNHLLISCLFN